MNMTKEFNLTLLDFCHVARCVKERDQRINHQQLVLKVKFTLEEIYTLVYKRKLILISQAQPAAEETMESEDDHINVLENSLRSKNSTVLSASPEHYVAYKLE
ncbi:hypothetical protein RF11_04647 [Thelohanellus kitauei]|uniref:Uncharacterized protein n=1 Tax=Thelohanellus kitauei TaxID=669202 RepID=A0A0C2MWG8_THEKT|nr:hypothetical protein RF11_04647 [Thelohanellus kitauei]